MSVNVSIRKQPYKVLLISENGQSCDCVRTLLDSGGESSFSLECAGEFSCGLDRLSRGGIDVVMLDLDLPEEQRLDRLAQVRAQIPDIPILMFNGRDGNEPDLPLIRRGAQDALPKKGLMGPWLRNSLHYALERQIQLNRLEQRTAQLQREADRLRTIIDGNADGIIIVDRRGIVRFANHAAERLFGHRAKDLRGRLLGHIIGKSQEVELDILHKNGSTGTVELHLSEITWEGQTSFLATIRDVSESRRLHQELQQSFDRSQRILEETVFALASAVETRDPFTAGHQRRVAKLTSAVARELGLNQKEIDGVRLAAHVHDIGKICIPSQILNKPGRLRDSEFNIVKEHPRVGHDILQPIEFPWPVAQMVMQHHERLDGSGYPCGLTEMDILPGARIIAVADVVDAMSSARTYQATPGTEKALQVINQCRGLQFDARVVDSCIHLFRDGKFQFE
jgi:putative nucleotidyltransferase with HDIG domain